MLFNEEEKAVLKEHFIIYIQLAPNTFDFWIPVS